MVDREVIQQYRSVFDAWVSGADVQVRYAWRPTTPETDNPWQDDKVPAWISGFEYRLKPQPLEFGHLEVGALFRVSAKHRNADKSVRIKIDTERGYRAVILHGRSQGAISNPAGMEVERVNYVNYVVKY